MKFRYGLVMAMAGAIAWAPRVEGAEQAGIEGLSLVVKLKSNRIGPIEPLQMHLTLTNGSQTKVEGLAHWSIRSSTTVEILTPGKTSWMMVEVPYLNRLAGKCGTFETPPLSLAAGESVSADLSVVYDPFDSYREDRMKYYLGQPGQYAVRAKYETGKGRTVVSNTMLFRVEPYAGADAAAYEWLKGRPVPHFMYDPDIYGQDIARDTAEDARVVMTRFADTRFAAPAQLYLARCYLTGLRHGRQIDPPNPDRAAELAGPLVRSGTPDVREAAAKLLNEIQRMRAAAISQPGKSQ